MHVHAGAVLAGDRLGHEGGVHAVGVRDLLDRKAVGHDDIGHLARLGVAQIDLVLRGSDLVVRVLDGDAELLEREHGLATKVARDVERSEIEVATVVEELACPSSSAK